MQPAVLSEPVEETLWREIHEDGLGAKKGKLVFCWVVQDPATGNTEERSLVVGPESMSDDEGRELAGVSKKKGKIKMGSVVCNDESAYSDRARQSTSKIVVRELVYNDGLTAQSGRLTQR